MKIERLHCQKLCENMAK